jgi:hypothetical protein
LPGFREWPRKTKLLLFILTEKYNKGYPSLVQCYYIREERGVYTYPEKPVLFGRLDHSQTSRVRRNYNQRQNCEKVGKQGVGGLSSFKDKVYYLPIWLKIVVVGVRYSNLQIRRIFLRVNTENTISETLGSKNFPNASGVDFNTLNTIRQLHIA